MRTSVPVKHPAREGIPRPQQPARPPPAQARAKTRPISTVDPERKIPTRPAPDTVGPPKASYTTVAIVRPPSRISVPSPFPDRITATDLHRQHLNPMPTEQPRPRKMRSVRMGNTYHDCRALNESGAQQPTSLLTWQRVGDEVEVISSFMQARPPTRHRRANVVWLAGSDFPYRVTERSASC